MNLNYITILSGTIVYTKVSVQLIAGFLYAARQLHNSLRSALFLH